MTMASTLTETETDGAKAKETGDSTQQPRFAVCVTTMNRVDRLTACLDQLARCDPPPSLVVVSDDSPDPSVRAANEAAVAAHPGVVYLAGPRRGVCANRNNAINHCLAQTSRCDYLSFLDDDILIDADFFAAARKHYEATPAQRRYLTVLTGGAPNGPHLHVCVPMHLSFACYFKKGDVPQTVQINASVFPLELFTQETFDENIFFGTEDAELCLRMLRRGYSIELEPGLRSLETMTGRGVLTATRAAGLTRYQLCCEAARLYIGVKRYRVIEPNLMRFAGFVFFYFGHMTVYLARRGALSQLVPIVRTSNVWRVFTGHGAR
jgi:Glycosyl transferase family 2